MMSVEGSSVDGSSVIDSSISDGHVTKSTGKHGTFIDDKVYVDVDVNKVAVDIAVYNVLVLRN